MEVHHHPKLNNNPKSWKEYFLEFLMIVLAVTTGFFAESYREYRTDREKEKQAIESLVKCLVSDTLQLNNIIESNLQIAMNLDSFVLLKNEDLTLVANKKQFYAHGSTGFFQDWYFKINDAAMQQLKSSGMLRLIRKQNIIDNIFGYELKNKITVAQEADCYNFFKLSLTDYTKVADLTNLKDTNVVGYTITNRFVAFKYKNVNNIFINQDKEKLSTVFNNAALMSAAVEAYAQFMKEQKEYAIGLIDLLNKEYHLENE